MSCDGWSERQHGSLTQIEEDALGTVEVDNTLAALLLPGRDGDQCLGLQRVDDEVRRVVDGRRRDWEVSGWTGGFAPGETLVLDPTRRLL